MMRNIGTMDMAITFGINGGVRNVGLGCTSRFSPNKPL